MIQWLQALARALVPRRFHESLIDAYLLSLSPFYRGTAFECPFCGGRFRKLRPTGFDAPANHIYQIVGAGRRDNALCPGCLSSERERLIYLYARRHTDWLDGSRPICLLHVAPEKNLRRALRRVPQIAYLCADLDPVPPMVRMDVTDIPEADGTFDVIICNHVLEHIPDDRRAMRELYRVLRPGGEAILQVPISRTLPKTYEDPAIATPRTRAAAFGQHDHVRVYGRDYMDRLSAVGFQVKPYDFAGEFGESEARRHALWSGEALYVCRKLGAVPSA